MEREDGETHACQSFDLHKVRENRDQADISNKYEQLIYEYVTNNEIAHFYLFN